MFHKGKYWRLWLLAFAWGGVLACPDGVHAEPSRNFELWPDGAPGETVELGEERDVTKPTDALIAGKPVIRLSNVSRPTVTVYRPPGEKRNGAAVLVMPGGGYHVLAMDLEGTEVCSWLNSLGVTAALLKYRVPRREGKERHAPALQDAQRAMGILRRRAAEFDVDPKRVGVLGFSAGGHLAAALSTSHKTRTYPLVDDADQASCRPDFAVLVYPGLLTDRAKGDALAPEVAVSRATPPTFLAMSQDDPVRPENVLHYALALQRERVPMELHLFPVGGHGYGLRRTDHLVTTWPDRAADWLRSQGWLSATQK